MRKIMVKFAAMAMVLVMVFTLAGCDIMNFKLGDILPNGNRMEGNMMSPEVAGNDSFIFDDEPDMVETAPTEAPIEIEIEAVEEYDVSYFMPHLEFLNTAFEETYGAEVDWNNACSRIYANEDACMNGEDPVEIRPGFYDYSVTNDPLAATVYFVTNCNSLDQWEESLAKYLSQEMIVKWAQEQDVLVEYGSKLFMLRAGRGYGSWLLELETAKLVSQGDELCSVTVDCYGFGEYECTDQVDFVPSDAGWVIANYYVI